MATVSDEAFRRYLEVFHREYLTTADTFIPEAARQGLLRYSLLPTRIVGYISTNHGAGFEYVEGDPGIELKKASSPVEELFSGAPPFLRRTWPLVKVGGPNVTLMVVGLEGTFPFRLDAPDANVSFFDTRFAYRNQWGRLVWRGSTVYAGSATHR